MTSISRTQCGWAWFLPLAMGLVWQSAAGTACAQGGPGQDAAPAFSEPKFRDKMWEAGGPRLSQIESGKIVLGVEIVGNKKISQHKIMSHMQTRPDRMYDPRQIEADVRELYRTELFARVETSTRETDEGVYVQVKVREHLLVSEVIFHGNERLDDKQLKKHCGIDKGDPVNPYSVENARKRLVEYYQEKGMNHADVQIREGHRPTDTRVWFEISEGNVERVWEIGFEGNQVITSAILKTKIKSKDAHSGATAFAFNIANLMQIEEDTQRLGSLLPVAGLFPRPRESSHALR